MTDTSTQIALTAETASEYDFIVVLDASGSMATGSSRFAGKTRWEEAQETIFGIAAELGKFDSDGIDIVVFGGSVDLFEGVSAEKVNSVFASRGPRGSTPLAEALQVVADKHMQSGKNTVALVFTDGAPDNQQAAEDVIVKTANAQDKDEAISFLFIQIGTDPGAAKFLEHLDNGLSAAKFDIVATIGAADAETKGALDLINLAING
jgi:hypothetical protein